LLSKRVFHKAKAITGFAPPTAATLAGVDCATPFFIAQGCAIAEVEKNFPSRALWRKQGLKTAKACARATSEAGACALCTKA
jgi:hypothetical protein